MAHTIIIVLFLTCVHVWCVCVNSIQIKAHFVTRALNKAESTMSAAKKAKRSALLSHVTAKEQEKQFKTEFNTNGAVLFCRFYKQRRLYAR